MLIYDAALKTPYRILGINLPKDSLLHLSNLGLAAGETIEVVTKTKNSAIIIVKGSRLAFDASILDKIDLAPAEEDQEKIPLSELPVGRSAIVTDIFSANETKRRLMDMGITKRTRVLLRKVAPLGDPLEISLRGYELTLRKSKLYKGTELPVTCRSDIFQLKPNDVTWMGELERVWGDPLEISLRGYELTLRKSEAQMISVVMLDEGEEK